MPNLTFFRQIGDGRIEKWTTAIPPDPVEGVAEYILRVAQPPRFLRFIDAEEELEPGMYGESAKAPTLRRRSSVLLTTAVTKQVRGS